MSVSLRSTLISGAAFATAGVMALGPNIVAPPVITLAQPVVQLPTVHVAEIALTGFTLDLYSALNGWAAFGVQVLQDFFFWNPDIAAGIGNFYTALERVVTAVVTTIDSLVGAPTDFMGTLTTIISTLLPAFGLGVPTLAAVGKPAASLIAARTGDGPRAAAAQLPEPVAVELPAVVKEVPRIICCSPQPEVTTELPVGEVPAFVEGPVLEALVVEAPAVEALVVEAPAVEASVADAVAPSRAARIGTRSAATAATTAFDSAAPSSTRAVRTPARTTRGTADRATSAARASVTAAADAAN
ncbi:MAG: hypothetical protein NT156_00555 [Mycobacterium sp.]|nr:hypothetical protein [Mycobacterium sp.]